VDLSRHDREEWVYSSREIEAAEFDGPNVKSPAARVFGKRDRPKSAGPLQYLIEQKKKQVRERPVTAAPWRDSRLNPCVSAFPMPLNERAATPHTARTTRHISATYRPARPFSAKAAKLNQPTGVKKKEKVSAKCSYCGSRTERVNYERGLFFNVCQACLQQTKRPISREPPFLEVHGQQVTTECASPSPVSSEQLSDVAEKVVSEALRSTVRDAEEDALSEIAEGVVCQVLQTAQGGEHLRVLAEKVLVLINGELKQRMQIASAVFPDELCRQLGALAKEVVVVMGGERYEPGDELKILNFSDEQLEGMARAAVAAVMDNIDNILRPMQPKQEQPEDEQLEEFAASIVSDVISKVKSASRDQVDQDASSEEAMSDHTADQETKLMTDLHELDESLNQVQKEIHECIVQSSSTSPPVSSRHHRSYNLTVYQYNEVSAAELDEVTMGEVSSDEETRGEISQYDVMLKRERSLLDDSAMDARLLDIICNQLSSSLKVRQSSSQFLSMSLFILSG
jgi:hypothetical protein